MADLPQTSPDLIDQLNKMVDAGSSQPAGSGGGGSADLIFGMSLWALVLASLFSLFGLAYLTYARKQGRLIIGLCGVALLVFPFLVTDVIPMTAIGVVLLFLPAILKRFGIDL